MKNVAEIHNLTEPRLLLNSEKVYKLMKSHEIKTDAELARRVGIDPTSVHRYLAGKSVPSNRAMAKFQSAFPLVPLGELVRFEAGA